MKGFGQPPSPGPGVTSAPGSCPFCQSSMIVTTSKSPDAESYWRCTNCGEVWNVSRAQADVYRGRRW